MFRDTLAALALLTFLSAPPLGAQEAEHADHDHDHAAEDHAADGDDHVAEAGGLRAVHAWTRATDEPAALVFVEIENRGEAQITLTGASSPRADAGELVGFRLADAAESYAGLPEMPIDAGGAVTLAPRGLAIRLDGLDAPLAEGESFPVTIASSAGALLVTVVVEAADAAAHSHAGHAHD